MNLGAPFWLLAGIAAAAALAYGLFFLNRSPSLLRALVKTAFMGALTAAFVFAGAPPPLILAFAAAALGDFMLAFDKTWTLGLGILAFLAMQLLYFVIFLALWLMSGDNAPLWPRYGLMALIAISVIACTIWLWSGERQARILTAFAVVASFALGLAIPVLMFGSLMMLAGGVPETPDVFSSLGWVLTFCVACVAVLWWQRHLGIVKFVGMAYAATITATAMMAMWTPWAGWPAILGMILFVISDGVLSAELFKLAPDAPQRRLTTPIVWWTYAAAQILIAWGLVTAARMMV